MSEPYTLGVEKGTHEYDLFVALFRNQSLDNDDQIRSWMKSQGVVWRSYPWLELDIFRFESQDAWVAFRMQWL